MRRTSGAAGEAEMRDAEALATWLIITAAAASTERLELGGSGRRAVASGRWAGQ